MDTSIRERLVEISTHLFDAIRAGTVQAEPRHRYPLDRAADAHRDLESRRTSGQLVLLP